MSYASRDRVIGRIHESDVSKSKKKIQKVCVELRYEFQYDEVPQVFYFFFFLLTDMDEAVIQIVLCEETSSTKITELNEMFFKV